MIGYGNTLRRDDGAGPFLVEQLRRDCTFSNGDVQFITAHQLMPELAEDVAREDVSGVIFVDAAVAGSGCTGTEVSLRRIGVSVSTPGAGHQMSPQVLMAYARLLYGRCPEAWVLTIPGIDYAHGEGFCRVTAAKLADARSMLVELLGRLLEGIPIAASLVQVHKGS